MRTGVDVGYVVKSFKGTQCPIWALKAGAELHDSKEFCVCMEFLFPYEK